MLYSLFVNRVKNIKNFGFRDNCTGFHLYSLISNVHNHIDMLTSKLVKTSWCRFQKRYSSKYAKVVTKDHEEQEITKIRNIGILAHIDAGKTTTTERMLYYSGLIKHMGEVHEGNTVTDYMDQERERGITITSAAVTFPWKNYRINLIDTPGHIDFTMEVEQTLRVLDGAIIILDGSAGVEAQTLTVCRQADKYDIPRIIYVNKMDRLDADFSMCLKSIQSKLNTEVLPTQFPIKENGILKGIVDILSMEKLFFDKKDMGMKFTTLTLSENEDKSLWEKAMEQRRYITDKLSNMDDKLADIIIEQESLDSISTQELVNSLYRSTISRKAVPVLLGSSYKNIGVQPLMDSVLLYLPSPTESRYSHHYHCFKGGLSARVFKIVHDKQKGPITFLRVYSGSLQKGTKLYNIRQDENEHVGRLYAACADDYEEVSKVTSGNIVAATGLKTTITGDLMTSSRNEMIRAKERLTAQKNIKEEDVEKIFNCKSKLVEPVFFCAIEAPSLSVQVALEAALQALEREDPSLRVTQNNETGQIVLAGMGELHLEIIKQRIKTEYKIDADLGPLQIAYRETITEPIEGTHTFEHKIGNTDAKVTVTMSLIPNYDGGSTLLLHNTPESRANIDAIPRKMIQAVKSGIQSVFMYGPKLSYPVLNMGVKLHWLEIGSGTTSSFVTASVSQCIRKLMTEVGVILLEPVMRMKVTVPEQYAGVVVKDLSKRRARIEHMDVHDTNKEVHCFAPLSELLGYSTDIRIISSGHASFTLEFDHYELMDAATEAKAIKRITGFE